MFETPTVSSKFHPDDRAVVFAGDCLEFLKKAPSEQFQLIVTSPPYNLGKEYEKRVRLDEYVQQQRPVIQECVRTLRTSGSICWEVGNYVDDGAIIPHDR
jgi:DNA modification methylase